MFKKIKKYLITVFTDWANYVYTPNKHKSPRK
jgi:hypothetical protein